MEQKVCRCTGVDHAALSCVRCNALENEVRGLKDRNERLSLKLRDEEKAQMNLRNENARRKTIQLNLERELEEQTNKITDMTHSHRRQILRSNEINNNIGRNYREKAEAAEKRIAEAEARRSAIEGELNMVKSHDQCPSREIIKAMNAYRERLEVLETKVQTLTKENEELSKSLELKEVQAKDAEEAKNKLFDSNILVEARNTVLEKELNKAKSESSQVFGELKSLSTASQDKLKYLETQVEIIAKEKDTISNSAEIKAANAKEVILNINAKMQKSEREKYDLLKQVSLFEARIRDLEADLNKAKSESIHLLKETKSLLTATQDILTAFQYRSPYLETQAEIMTNEKDELKEAKAEEVLQSIETNIPKTDEEKKKLLIQINLSEARNRVLEEELAKAKLEQESSQDRVKDLENQVEIFVKEKDEISKYWEMKAAKSKEVLNNTKAKIQKLHEQYDYLSSEESQTSCKMKDTERKEFESLVNSLRQDKGKLEEEMSKMVEEITNLKSQIDSLQQELLTVQLSTGHRTRVSRANEVGEVEAPELKEELRGKFLEEQLKSLSQEKDDLEIKLKHALKENDRLVNQIDLSNMDLKDKKIVELGGKLAKLECTITELTGHIEESRASKKALTDEKDLQEITIKSLNETIQEDASLRNELELSIINKEEILDRLAREKEEKDKLIQTLNDQKCKWMECEKKLSAQIKATENKNEALIIRYNLLSEKFTDYQQKLKQSEFHAIKMEKQIEIKDTAIESLMNKLDEKEIVNESRLRKCQNYEKYIDFSMANDENIERYVKEKKDKQDKLRREIEKIENDNNKRVTDLRQDASIDQGSPKRMKMDLS